MASLTARERALHKVKQALAQDPSLIRQLTEVALLQPPAFIDDTFPDQAAFIRHPSKRKVLLATRRAGKSVAAGRYMFLTAHENPGCSIIYIGLTRESAKRIMVKDILQPLQDQLGVKVAENKTELSFTFPNRATIYLLGMDQSEQERRKLFGQRYKLAIIDESALYSIDMRGLVYSAIEPALMDLQGTLVLMGMPSNKAAGLFYDLTKDARPCNPSQWDIIDEKGGTSWHGFCWSWAQNHSRPVPGGPTIAESIGDEVAKKKLLNPRIEDTPIYMQEYLGLWVPAGSFVFGPPTHYTSLPSGYRVVIGVDFAFSTSTRADFNVACVLAEYNNIYYIIDVIRRKCEITEFDKELRKLMVRFPRAPFHLHGFGTETGTISYMRQAGIPISIHPPVGSKLGSAQAVSAAWNEGRVQVPGNNPPWLVDFLEEVGSFVGDDRVDPHDDQVDALGNAHRHLPSRYVAPPMPVTGSPEWAKAEEAKMLDAARQSVRNKNRPTGWKR